jgi:autotransporter-associated beta strand protein
VRSNRRKTTALITATAAVTSLLAGARLAHAADYVWNGATDTLWSTGTNWTPNGVPSSSTDTMTFDNSGTANLNNSVDPALTGLPYAKLTYTVDDPTKIYNTSIDRNVTLSLFKAAGGNIPTPTAASLLVEPATSATSTATGTIAKISSSGTGSLGKLSLTSSSGNLALAVTGRPGASTATAESFAVLDLSGLDEFTFSTAPSFSNSNFGVGVGNGATGDNGLYSGKVILANLSTILANRVTIGGQSNAGALGNQANSMLVLGQTTNIGTTLSGNLNVGADGTYGAKDPSGVVIFRAGLTNPVFNQGDTASSRNGLQVGDARNNATGHYSYGVVDLTSASAGSDGTVNAGYTTMRIGEASNGTTFPAGGGFGMYSFDKGTVNANGAIVGGTRAAADGGPTQGVINVGVKGGAGDAGAGSFEFVQATLGTPATLTLGSRTSSTHTSVSTGILNVANTGSVSVDRVALGDNTVVNDATHDGTSVGILNLGGGILKTGQIKAGGSAVQLGTNNVRIVNFNGGTVQVKAVSDTLGNPTNPFVANYMEGLTAANVYSGGATFDTNGVDTTINQALVAPSGNGVSGATIAPGNGGSGYRSAPIVVVARGVGDTTGTGATAVAQIDSTGAVTGITITNPGTDYTVAPVFQLVANAGTNFANMQKPVGDWNGTTFVAGVAATVSGAISANVSGGITKTGAGTLTLNGANTYTGPTNVNDGTLKLGANLTTSSNVAVSGTGTLLLPSNGNNNRVVKTGNVSVTGSGKINIDDNKLILTAQAVGTWNGSAYDGVTGLIAAGYSPSQDFSGNGIVTTQSNATGGNTLTNIGVASNADLGVSTFGGQSVGANDTLVAYTYGGDANLDGAITGDDYFQIDSGFPAGAHGWFNGDFNYDGVINGDDYFIIDSNFPAQGAAFPTAAGQTMVQAVPEPMTGAICAAAALMISPRQRRRRR